MRLLKAILIILVLPAALVVIGVFQDYADEEMSMNVFETLIMGAWPFLLVALFIVGIFLAIRRIGGSGEDN